MQAVWDLYLYMYCYMALRWALGCRMVQVVLRPISPWRDVSLGTESKPPKTGPSVSVQRAAWENLGSKGAVGILGRQF